MSIQKLPKRRKLRISPAVILAILLIAIGGLAIAFTGAWSSTQTAVNLSMTRQVEAGQTAVYETELTLTANP